MKPVPEGPIGVAVSGGGDSVALLVLLAEWAVANDRRILAVTVDHGLRAEAAAEAAQVARICARLGVAHETLRWNGGAAKGNLQDAARQARQELIAAWAIKTGIRFVAAGHTRDDQAETFLLRLKRGSGVDGLAAMAPEIAKSGVTWIRPLLEMRRAELRAFLVAREIGWVEDPSNEDLRFDRVKMRKALDLFQEIGVDVDTLADTALRMARARRVLQRAAFQVAKMVCAPQDDGSLHLDLAGLATAEEETAYRILAHGLGWVSSARYRPRFGSLERAMAALQNGQAHTLSGCVILPLKDGMMEIAREQAAVEPLLKPSGVFDGRWQCVADMGMWRALGEDGIAQRPNWRETGRSRKSVLAQPSLWYNNELMSAPFVDSTGLYKCSLIGGSGRFFDTFLTH